MADRPMDPLEISVDSSRAPRELGWSHRTGLEVPYDMLNGEAEHKNVD
jgi:hypothetical protein